MPRNRLDQILRSDDGPVKSPRKPSDTGLDEEADQGVSMRIPAQVHTQKRIKATLAILAALSLSACGSIAGDLSASNTPTTNTPASNTPAAAEDQTEKLSKEVSDVDAFAHLQDLQKIADANGGNRATPSPGYEASVDYVIGSLRTAGYDVSTPTYKFTDEDEDGGGHGGGGVTLRNVIAQTRTGDPGHVVMIGAHLDSVPGGPGIVDDGSGVATLLEIAHRLGGSPTTRNAVRFAFFGSEESDGQGSSGYVKSLSAEERGKIQIYLNVDMVASPNAGYFVQGGKGGEDSESVPPGSAAVAEVLAGQLVKTGVTPENIKFVGDDESAFVEAGIPSAGAENGDAKKKTTEQVATWSGQAGQVYDRCYHKSCDRLENVNRVVFNHYLRALAGTLAHFAASTEKVTR